MTKSPRILTATAALAAVMLLAPPDSADATLFVKGTFDTATLSDQADTIVVGTVLTTRSEWDGDRIVTRATVRVDQLVRGAPVSTIEVVVPGGKVGDVRARVIGGPTLRKGQTSLVLARSVGRFHSVVGLAHGVLPVVEATSGQQKVAWIPPGETRYRWDRLGRVTRALAVREFRRAP